MNAAASTAWTDAVLAMTLFAIDPVGLGGVSLRAPAGAVRAAWLDLLAVALPAEAARRRMPATIGDAALLGGLDLPATLQAGRPVAAAGLLASSDGGVIILAMAERLLAGTAARLTAVLDSGTTTASHAGAPQSSPCRVGIVALDEGIEPEERPCPALLDRLAFPIDLSGLSHRDIDRPAPDRPGIETARRALGAIAAEDTIIAALVGTCLALGIGSARAPLLALRAARAAAALAGRDAITLEDAAVAARLVLSPRATLVPGGQEDAAQDPPPADGPPTPQNTDQAQDDSEPAERETGQQAAEILLDAARAAIPAGLLARLQSPDAKSPQAGTRGSAGARQTGGQRGRPAGVRAASPDGANRLNLIETLRAAAPWQRLRAAQSGEAVGRRVLIRREDFRVTCSEQRARSLTLFLVDASGSAAFARLAEAKGAVELLLADCYRRRDQVALIAFRGARADLLLPPTRSLVRAKRELASLPGGGGTPMAAGIEAGFRLAETARRGGFTPTLVLLTDGRANVTRAGAGGRAAAQDEAAFAARQVRAAGLAALVLDTSPRPGAEAGRLAREMGALYVPLPYANAAAVSGAVRAASARP